MTLLIVRLQIKRVDTTPAVDPISTLETYDQNIPLFFSGHSFSTCFEMFCGEDVLCYHMEMNENRKSELLDRFLIKKPVAQGLD